MIKYSSKEEIENYYNSNNISQSKLKNLINGLEPYLEKEKEEKKKTKSFIIGSAVDCILTNEINKFNDNYYISKENNLSDKEKEITELIFNDVLQSLNKSNIDKSHQLCVFINHILKIINKENWQKNWKEETRINKIIKNCSDYFEELKISHNKIIITNEEYKIIENVCNSLKTNDRTRHYFNKPLVNELYEHEYNKIYYQYPIYFNYRGLKCKALIDILICIANFETNRIEVGGIDLKTTGTYTKDFHYSLRKFNYHIQAAWYQHAIKQEIDIIKHKYNKYHGKPKVVFNNFKFIVESTKYTGNPLVYEVSDDLLNIGKYGIKDNFNFPTKIKGYEDLIDDYIYYEKTNFKEDRIIKENEKNNILKLDWDGIIIS